jgi:DNA-binding NarL/FixJ family response regulator
MNLRVLLDRDVEPMFRLGIIRTLGEGDVQVLDGDGADAGVVEAAGRLRPDVVVLEMDDAAEALRASVREVAPDAKVIICARDETELTVFDPGATRPRRIRRAIPDALVREVRVGTCIDIERRRDACPRT